MRPRRSALFMPGNNPRAQQKARTLPCDLVILDLEDAVAPSQKAVARETTVLALAEDFGSRERWVRINGTDTPWWQDDLRACAEKPLNAIVLPKTETVAQVQQVAETMNALGYPEQVRLWLMAETPRGVLEAHHYCGAHDRVAGLIMGTSDLSKCLRLPQQTDRIGLLHALSHCVLAARMHGLSVLDGVCLNLDDDKAFEAECRQGRMLGFDGKTLIHPKQIETANRQFSPTDAEITAARQILEAWALATREGSALCVLNGQLIEHLHVEAAEQLLSQFGATEHARQDH